MKKLVEKKDISSWRNPTDVDKESIAKKGTFRGYGIYDYTYATNSYTYTYFSEWY